MLKVRTQNVLIGIGRSVITSIGDIIGSVIAPIVRVPTPGQGIRRESTSPPKQAPKPEEQKRPKKGGAPSR